MWKKYVKISVMFGLFFLVFGLGVFLPERLFAIADEKKEAATKLNDTTSFTFPDAEQAAIEKKLHLLYDKDNLPSLHFFQLDYDAEELAQIQKVITRETKKLRKYKLIPKKSSLTDFYEEKHSIINTDETGDFVTMWFIWKSVAPNGILQFWIEAESGKIVAVNFSDAKKRNWKPAKKAFQKYLWQELSIDTKDIPEFNFYYTSYGYAISSERLLTYQGMLGFTDSIDSIKPHMTDVSKTIVK